MIRGMFSAALATLTLSFPGDIGDVLVTPVDIPVAPTSPEPDTLRTLQPEDLFRLHRLGEVRFSPDGRVMAFVQGRSGEEGPITRLPERVEPRGDIWIVADDETEPRRLTTGASDGRGWFHPRWSPDGERLAFLSIDGRRIRAWVWHRSRDELRPVGDRSVHLTSIGPLLFRWISDRELAFAVRPEGEAPRGRLLAEYGRPGLYAAQKWQESWDGREVTADLLDMDPDSTSDGVLSKSEVRIHEIGGDSEVVARGRFGLGWPSPDGRWLATFSEPPVGTVSPERPMHQWMTFGTRPGAVPLEKGSGLEAQRGPAPASLHQPIYGTLQWAPDGSAYAFLFLSVEDDDQRPVRRLAVYRPADGELQILDDPDTRVRDLAWTGDSRLLALAHHPSEDAAEGRFDWWHVSAEGEWRQGLTTELSAVPDDLVPVPGGAAGVADGALWKLGGDGGPERLTAGERTGLHGIVWPSSSRPFSGGATSLRSAEEPIGLLTRSSSGREVRVVRVGDSNVRDVARIPVPEGEGAPADLAPGRAAAAFSRTDDTGSWLFRTRGTSSEAAEAVDTVLAEDRWLTEVQPGETRQLTYSGPNGQELTAWAILPPGHEEGQRHPTVVSFYPGRTYGEREPSFARLNRTWSISALQLLAARGFAVLLPSVPLDPETPARPNFAALILPAVEEAVDAGLADGSSVGVMGHSYGGYGVHHLVSQTDRFEAAVVSAGATHLRSHYGILDARSRYGHMARPEALQLNTMAYFESGQGRMGAPPFRAPERYRDGSPLSYTDEVDTPLLMIHGDQDFVPIQQAEMLFTELLRQGKRVRLVRYAGEGHTVKGRANVLHMWEEIFGWFGDFLGSP